MSSTRQPKLDIIIDNEVVDKGRVKYLKRGDKYLFWNRIYAKGEDMDKVKEITYSFHPSFPNPVIRVRDRESGFEVITWVWGEFNIKIIITTEYGEEHYVDFPFRFGDKLRDAKRNNIIFEEVEKESS